MPEPWVKQNNYYEVLIKIKFSENLLIVIITVIKQLIND